MLLGALVGLVHSRIALNTTLHIIFPLQWNKSIDLVS